MKKLNDLLEGIAADIDEELGSMPDIVEKEPGRFDVDSLPFAKREWHRLDDVVAVAVDLKGSSKLSTGKHAASTASIYEASTDNAVAVLDNFDADFIQIQGDGAFGLFWGEGSYGRALCAGITVKTISVGLAAKIAAKWPKAPQTGYKVGIASGRVLAKLIGTPRNPSQQEPIWSGKPVNYAVKAAQTAEVGELIVSGDVWASIEDNDYLTTSCGHGGSAPVQLWVNTTIENVPVQDDARHGRLLRSAWCEECGESFCEAILAGKTERPEAAVAAEGSRRAARDTNLARVIDKKRGLRTAHIRGMKTR
ncbi:hypothetical protein JM654_00835 [Microbacterium oxydans]|nr:hypothetical protein [Microbacterium oxydans]